VHLLVFSRFNLS